MIITPRTITDGKDALVERVLVEPRTFTMQEAEAIGFKQFACQVGERIIKQGQMARSEPVYFEFNAPSYLAAFEYAREHRAEEQAKFRKEANAARARAALLHPPTNGEINRLKLSE